MYIPAHFDEPNLERLHEFIEQHSFGVLVSQVDGIPFATHLPILLEWFSFVGARNILVVVGLNQIEL